MGTSANSFFTMLRIYPCFCWCSCGCFILLSIATHCFSVALTPPVGNSIALSTTTLNGKQTYSCRNGMWQPVSIAAMLVDSQDEQKTVGSYSRTFSIAQSGGWPDDDDEDNAGTWSLINDDGDAAESGHSSSIVAGKLISRIAKTNYSQTNLPDFLAQASLHSFDGQASRVSYIMQRNAIHGALPSGSCVHDLSSTLDVTFRAEYIFWKQDMEPPAMMPFQIAVDRKHERPLEAFFAAGAAAYVAINENAWAVRGAAGRLYDLPGGMELGSFHMKLSEPSLNMSYIGALLCLRIKGATTDYGFACARLFANIGPIVVDSKSLPWFVMGITNSTGNLITMGSSLTSIQMISTLGGMAPSTPPNTLNETYYSNFTAIFWIYTHQD